MSPKSRDIKERINKWDLIKIKSFCMAQENSIKIKRELGEGGGFGWGGVEGWGEKAHNCN